MTSLAETLNLVPRCCYHGHLLTGDNTREERNASSKNGVRIRCKVCVKEQKQRRYAQPGVRHRRLAYEHHYRNGHPEGLLWDEIKLQLEGATS